MCNKCVYCTYWSTYACIGLHRNYVREMWSYAVLIRPYYLLTFVICHFIMIFCQNMAWYATKLTIVLNHAERFQFMGSDVFHSSLLPSKKHFFFTKTHFLHRHFTNLSERITVVKSVFRCMDVGCMGSEQPIIQHLPILTSGNICYLAS
jgi:hypothetical protein